MTTADLEVYAVAWYIVGVVSILVHQLKFFKEITIKDILASLFFGFFGLMATLIVIFSIFDSIEDNPIFKLKGK